MEAVTGHLVLDEHVAKVLEFMEREVPADRLEYVASRMPAIARVIWAQDRCASLFREPISRAPLSSASESGLAAPYAGDDSVAVMGAE
jgi:hypothetical protein